ncbi:thiaminase (transcriptional activator TenA) [Granulicatella balaenopterae]|uniref:Aminopyrimidine aminohydrolase n=1 Tax=Granulicatella balaenopterae TaxID=137733 RepID=A0A1H9KYN9_9LACT|nr:thiaminase II [Granulicatella balaenopterae]SER04119.1 thiaminase (transcriptional activator TenA) [Granulicatella balaenopterae]
MSGKLSDYLLYQVEDLWQGYLEHPFIIGMATGELEERKFSYYLLQDYLYLKEYIKVFAVTLSKADDFSEIKFLLDSMNDIFEETFRVHVPYMKRLGISEEEIQSVQPHPSNINYTNDMLLAAQSGDVLDGLVAILSCSWSYAYIARETLKIYPTAMQDERYGEWFEGYYCSEYQLGNEELIQHINQLAQGITAEKRERLATIFTNCSQHEMNFWDMAWQQG